MGKILFTQETEKGALHFIAGTVKEVREGSGKATGQVRHLLMDLSVRGEGTKKVRKELEVALWNSSKEPDNKRKQLATRSTQAKVGVGSFVLLTCGNLTDKESGNKDIPLVATTAFAFDYNTRRSVDVDNEKGVFTDEVICGVIRRAKFEGEHPYIVVPVDVYTDAGKSTDWLTLFLGKCNSEAAQTHLQIGTPIACLTSEIRESEHDGRRNLAATIFEYVIGQPKGA